MAKYAVMTGGWRRCRPPAGEHQRAVEVDRFLERFRDLEQQRFGVHRRDELYAHRQSVDESRRCRRCGGSSDVEGNHERERTPEGVYAVLVDGAGPAAELKGWDGGRWREDHIEFQEDVGDPLAVDGQVASCSFDVGRVEALRCFE